MTAEFVKQIDITVSVRITRYPKDEGGWMYDWRASNGAAPDEWFETEEEAVRDAKDHF